MEKSNNQKKINKIIANCIFYTVFAITFLLSAAIVGAIAAFISVCFKYILK